VGVDEWAWVGNTVCGHDGSEDGLQLVDSHDAVGQEGLQDETMDPGVAIIVGDIAHSLGAVV
jgi:hypothetical protein